MITFNPRAFAGFLKEATSGCALEQMTSIALKSKTKQSWLITLALSDDICITSNITKITFNLWSLPPSDFYAIKSTSRKAELYILSLWKLVSTWTRFVPSHSKTPPPIFAQVCLEKGKAFEVFCSSRYNDAKTLQHNADNKARIITTFKRVDSIRNGAFVAFAGGIVNRYGNGRHHPVYSFGSSTRIYQFMPFTYDLFLYSTKERCQCYFYFCSASWIIFARMQGFVITFYYCLGRMAQCYSEEWERNGSRRREFITWYRGSTSYKDANVASLNVIITFITVVAIIAYIGSVITHSPQWFTPTCPSWTDVATRLVVLRRQWRLACSKINAGGTRRESSIRAILCWFTRAHKWQPFVKWLFYTAVSAIGQYQQRAFTQSKYPNMRRRRIHSWRRDEISTSEPKGTSSPSCRFMHLGDDLISYLHS